VIFHLIDARHGPTEEDTKIMHKIGTIMAGEQQQHNAKYVIVLTKCDKNVKSASSEKNPGKVPRSVLEKLTNTMKSNQVGYAPIVLTSAETRLGRDEVWKYLRLAAEK
jgi:GTP-binding protein EngB required for normal cell division